MSNLKRHVKSDKFKWILTFVSIVLIVGLLISVCVGMNNMKTTDKVGRTDYSICAINTTTGANVDSYKSITMKNIQKVDGLVIELDDNAQITYKVAFYDEDKDFVSISNAQSGDFATAGIPATATYFRVSIMPNQVDGEDVIVNVWNMSNYINQITITFNK